MQIGGGIQQMGDVSERNFIMWYACMDQYHRKLAQAIVDLGPSRILGYLHNFRSGRWGEPAGRTGPGDWAKPVLDEFHRAKARIRNAILPPGRAQPLNDDIGAICCRIRAGQGNDYHPA